MRKALLLPLGLGLALAISGCGNRFDDGGLARDSSETGNQTPPREEAERGESIFNLFRPPKAENTVQVNRYIWSATIEVLDFLPVQSVDPFSGVIVYGFGTPPNGGRSYRATVLIRDPALEARSLSLSLQTRSGPASAATVRAVEDAILTRARQLRVQDKRL